MQNIEETSSSPQAKMMKSNSKRLSSSIKNKLTFRRRKNTDDDDDLLSLFGMEPLNPSSLNSTPNLVTKYSNRSLRKTKSSTPVKPKSISIKTTAPSTSTPKKTKSKRERLGAGPAPSVAGPEGGGDNSLSSSIRSMKRSDALSPQAQRDFNHMVNSAATLDNAANDLFAKGRYNQALASYTRALQLKKRSLKFGVLVPESENAQKLLASVATSINNIGYLRQRNGGGTSEEIMTAYQDSLQIKREILGRDDLSVGKTLNNIGSVYFGTRQYAKALVAYEEACNILTLHLGATHLDVATVHSNIGDVHLAQRHLAEARAQYAIALEIRWSQLPDGNPKVVRLLEKIAAIDMADTPEKIEEIQLADDEDFIVEEGEEPVIKQFQELRVAVQEDVTYVEGVKRHMALEMIRDKIQMIREMRELESGALYGDDAGEERADSPVSLTASEREQALNEIKERVESMKRRKSTSCSRRRYNTDTPESEGVADRIEMARAQASSSIEDDPAASNNLQAKFEAAAIS
jgi:tetratricopeptide (TPR) repeat protein